MRSIHQSRWKQALLGFSLAIVAIALPLSPAGAQSPNLVSGNFENAAGARAYRFYIPNGYRTNSGPALPLLVFLHGCGQKPEDFLRATGAAATADKEQFFVLVPVQDNSHNTLGCWNWYESDSQRRDAGEPSIIVGMVDKLARDFKVDLSRVYIAGFSAGAAMASNLAACYPDIFAGAAIGSGLSFEAATSMVQAFQAMSMGGFVSPRQSGEDAYKCSGLTNLMMPTIIFHGAGDTTVSPKNSQQVLEAFIKFNDLADDGNSNDSIAARQVITTSEQVPSGHSYKLDTLSYAGKPLVQRYLVQSMPHAWSGGAGSQYMDAAGPNASQLLWNFFKMYRRLPASRTQPIHHPRN